MKMACSVRDSLLAPSLKIRECTGHRQWNADVEIELETPWEIRFSSQQSPFKTKSPKPIIRIPSSVW